MSTEKNKTCCISSWDRFGRKNTTVCFRVSKTIRDLFISISRDKLDWGRQNNKYSFWRQTSLSGIQYNEGQSALKKKIIRGVKQKKNCLFINILGSNLGGPLPVSTMINIKSNYPEKPCCRYFVTEWVITCFNAARMQCSVLSEWTLPTFVTIITNWLHTFWKKYWYYSLLLVFCDY